MEAAVKYLESRGKRVFGLLGHSKGGTNVILYASRHDGDGVRIVNVCGRCHLKTGISARFDEETLARLEREGSLQLPHRADPQIRLHIITALCKWHAGGYDSWWWLGAESMCDE